MFMLRSATTIARRVPMKPVARRTFMASVTRRNKEVKPDMLPPGTKDLQDIRTMDDLLPPGGEVGEIPSDAEQATGLERLELLGKMQGIDIFDMKPLDASRKGTMDNPINVRSAGDEQYAGCTGYPADSHVVRWIVLDRKRPIGRCSECGSVYNMEYVGPPDDAHGHDDHHHGPRAEDFEIKNISDYVKPEYYYR